MDEEMIMKVFNSLENEYITKHEQTPFGEDMRYAWILAGIVKFKNALIEEIKNK